MAATSMAVNRKPSPSHDIVALRILWEFRLWNPWVDEAASITNVFLRAPSHEDETATTHTCGLAIQI